MHLISYNLLKSLYNRTTPTVIQSVVEDYLTANPPAGYTHPPTHPATMITEDASKRFVTDIEKAAWNDKADGEVSVVLTQDRATASASFVDVTGMTFTALANSTYIIEFFLVFQSNNTLYGIGYGITGPASPGFCVGHVDLMLAASTRYVNNITGYDAVNGTSASVVAINTNYPGYVWVILRTGANGGAVTLRQRSENASGTVTTKAGSTLRYRKVA